MYFHDAGRLRLTASQACGVGSGRRDGAITVRWPCLVYDKLPGGACFWLCSTAASDGDSNAYLGCACTELVENRKLPASVCPILICIFLGMVMMDNGPLLLYGWAHRRKTFGYSSRRQAPKPGSFWMLAALPVITHVCRTAEVPIIIMHLLRGVNMGPTS